MLGIFNMVVVIITPPLFLNGLLGFFDLLCLCFLVCHLTGVPHSGGNAHLWKNHKLHEEVDRDNASENQYLFHVCSFVMRMQYFYK